MTRLEDTVSIITSCSLKGWHDYGQKGVATLLQYWPKELTVHLVSEDELPWQQLPLVDQPNRLAFWNLNDFEPAKKFYEQHASNDKAKGISKNPRHGGYDFRLDAYRFSKKVFALRMVSQNMYGGRLLWLDADTTTLVDVPLELLQRLPPNDYHVAYLDRGQGYHSECGFVGYNLNYPSTREFLIKFASLYETGEVFSLKEWHDSWVFDWLRKNQQLRCYAIPHSNAAHPFVYSELGQYIDHLKGSRKARGLSPEHPRFKPANKQAKQQQRFGRR